MFLAATEHWNLKPSSVYTGCENETKLLLLLLLF